MRQRQILIAAVISLLCLNGFLLVRNIQESSSANAGWGHTPESGATVEDTALCSSLTVVIRDFDDFHHSIVAMVTYF